MKRNVTIFTLLLVTEVAIALFHFHKFIRGFVGDVLVVPLLFYFLRFFTKWKTFYLAGAVLALAIIIELLQGIKAFKNIQLNSIFLQTVLGTTFDYKDIIAYCIGFLLLLGLEKFTSHE